MTRVVVDPDEMRQFAKTLESVTEVIAARKRALESGFSDLRDVWRDGKYARFETVFGETLHLLDPFLRQAVEFAHYLRGKARKADEYLENRY